MAHNLEMEQLQTRQADELSALADEHNHKVGLLLEEAAQTREVHAHETGEKRSEYERLQAMYNLLEQQYRHLELEKAQLAQEKLMGVVSW